MRRKRCDGKISVVKKEKGYSSMQNIWSGGSYSGQVTWVDYKCSKGHEWTSSSKEKSCYKKIK